MKLSYISALLLAYFFYRFSQLYPRRMETSPLRSLVLKTAVVSLALYLLLPGALTLDVVFHHWGKEVLLSLPAYILFAFAFLYLFIGGQVRLALRARQTRAVERTQLIIIVSAVSIAGLFGIYYNLLLPSPFFQDFRYIWSGPVFTFLFAVVITYSIFRFRLFNPRAILAELLVYILLLFLFVRLILTDSTYELVINGSLLVAVAVVGLILVRSVTHEVEQRELIEKQEKELEQANQQQESLLHFISHEVKGYMAKSEAAFAAIVAKDYGEVTPQLDRMAHLALADTRMGVTTVMNILDASNLKRGTVSYQKKPFDLVRAVAETVEELRPSAEHKGLALQFHKPVTGAYTFTGDEEKIRRHVIRNLIDNSIKYTPHGEVRVELSRNDQMIRLVVSDTGVGITPDDMEHLFTEGGHGKNSIRVNVHSTGYGLFIAKQIAEGHGGTIRAESEGEGKGSRFIVELPIKA